MWPRIFIVAIFAFTGCVFDPGASPNNVDNNTDDRDSGTADTLNNGNNQTNVNNRNNRRDLGGSDVSTDSASDLGADLPSEDMAPDLPTMCGGMAVDVLNDPVNCGACDNRCDPRFGQCAGGDCVCPGDTLPCGVANRCTDVMLDPNNCGVCGETCGTAQFCIAGDCVCRPGYELCGGECVDLDTNPQHCGMCNNDCGANGCQNGECRNSPDCGFAFTCDQPNGGPACITAEDSEWNCNPSLANNCGTQCAGDEVCVDPGIFQSRRCLRYRPAIICTQCPCNECSSSEICIVSEDVPGEIYCVDEP